MSSSSPARPRRALAFERGCLWALDLGEGSLPAPLLPDLAAVFGELRREHADRLAVAAGLPDADPVAQRLASGRRCFAAWFGGRIAAYGWISQVSECIGELEREIRLPKEEAYIWDCLTLPEFRRRRLYSALLCHVARRLGQEGFQRAWIGSSLANRPSLRGFANAGFRPVMRVSYARLFNLQCLLLSPYPRAPAELFAAARRRLISEQERAWGALIVTRSLPAQLPACT